MTDWMLMVRVDEARSAEQAPRETATLLDAQAAYVASERARGRLKDTARLRPSKEGRRVHGASGVLQVDGGPFSEGGRALGAYHVVAAESAAAAAALAAAIPTAPSDEIDVRPIMKGSFREGKEDQPGKVFAFGVLGSAANEDAWQALMDRVDEATKDAFLGAELVGGVRLERPGLGRRVATDGGRRAIFDGPFMESKEVIGGIFFARMATIEDAVAWAKTTPFVRLATLEIRELWRS